jgi:chemotaxis receptor (MCP) glutamine deamidase CheD
MIAESGNVRNPEAKIVGGANRFFTEESFLKIGEQNVVAAKIIREMRVFMLFNRMRPCNNSILKFLLLNPSYPKIQNI